MQALLDFRGETERSNGASAGTKERQISLTTFSTVRPPEKNLKKTSPECLEKDELGYSVVHTHERTARFAIGNSMFMRMNNGARQVNLR